MARREAMTVDRRRPSRDGMGMHRLVALRSYRPRARAWSRARVRFPRNSPAWPLFFQRSVFYPWRSVARRAPGRHVPGHRLAVGVATLACRGPGAGCIGLPTPRARREASRMALKAPGILSFLLSIVLALAVVVAKAFPA